MLLRTDLHIHSALSPCGDDDMTPGNIIAMAMLNKLDVIAITDHQTCGNCRSALALAEELTESYGDAVPVVLPGLEVTSAEEIHLLCLFADLASAETWSDSVKKALPPLKNRPDIFGRQLLFDEHDLVTGEESQLLMVGTQMSVQEIALAVRSLGGACLPAHVDRSSNSMLSVFGVMPDDFPVSYLEISWQTELALFYKQYPLLSKYPIIRNSDAHYLSDIADPGWPLKLTGHWPRKDWQHKVISSLR